MMLFEDVEMIEGLLCSWACV